MHRVIVTGGSGFIGAHLVRALSAAGHDVRTPSHTELDIGDEQAVFAYVRHVGPDRIFNLAGYRGTDEATAERINVLGTANVLRAAEAMRVRACIHAGTCVEYGNAATPFIETEAPQPLDVYGITKLKATRLVVAADVPAAVLRFTNVYGPGSVRDIVQKIREASRGGGRVPVSSDIYRDYLYISDAVDALIKADDHIDTIQGEIINISSNRAVSTAELAACAEKILGREPGALADAGAYALRADQQISNQADNAKAARCMGWTPAMPLEQGLIRSFA